MPPTPSPHALIRALRPSTPSVLPRALHRPPRQTPIPRFVARSTTAHAFTTTTSCPKSKPPASHDRGPPSQEDTQTDFGTLNILGDTAAPTTGIDACTADGFALNSGLRVTGSGVLLIGGEVFRWRPWIREGRVEGTVGEGGRGDDKGGMGKGGGGGGGRGLGTGRMRDQRGMWEVDPTAWGVLDLVWPKPGEYLLRSCHPFLGLVGHAAVIHSTLATVVGATRG